MTKRLKVGLVGALAIVLATLVGGWAANTVFASTATRGPLTLTGSRTMDMTVARTATVSNGSLVVQMTYRCSKFGPSGPTDLYAAGYEVRAQEAVNGTTTFGVASGDVGASTCDGYSHTINITIVPDPRRTRVFGPGTVVVTAASTQLLSRDGWSPILAVAGIDYRIAAG